MEGLCAQRTFWVLETQQWTRQTFILYSSRAWTIGNKSINKKKSDSNKSFPNHWHKAMWWEQLVDQGSPLWDDMINENLDDRRAQGHEHPLLGCLPPFSTAPSFSASSAISRGSYVRTALPAQAFHQAGHLLSFLIHSFNRLKRALSFVMTLILSVGQPWPTPQCWYYEIYFTNGAHK